MIFYWFGKFMVESQDNNCVGFRKQRISTNDINLTKDMYDNVVTNVRATRSDKDLVWL